ncbi:MAG: deoxyribonuclease V [Spirulina sp. SIO3F2]|nr:deoxyribonuclease V [Spirulina sp. SIO3F2]
MKAKYKHDWVPSFEAAKAIQSEWRSRVITTDQLGEVRYVAGLDAGFDKAKKLTKAAAVVLSFPELQLVEQVTAQVPTEFPYVPGYLSFREIPGLLAALTKLTITPDLILCDGQGYAHPRRFGLACHLGVVLDCPTIGVAKSRFIGEHDPVPPEKGKWSPLLDRGEMIGAVLRSRTNTKPLYVSIGHRVSLETAIDYVLRCTPQYRLPETTRRADRLASE